MVSVGLQYLVSSFPSELTQSPLYTVKSRKSMVLRLVF